MNESSYDDRGPEEDEGTLLRRLERDVKADPELVRLLDEGGPGGGVREPRRPRPPADSGWVARAGDDR